MAVTPTKQRVPIDMALLEIINHRIENRADDPEILVEGHVWLNTTDHKTKRVENGEIVPFFSKADAEKIAGFEVSIGEAQAAAEAAQEQIDAITSDDILSKYEKSVIKAQYDLLVAEQSGLDTIASSYSITTEKTNYDNSITALTSYITGLAPAYDDYTQDTVIDGDVFRGLFADVYLTRQILANAMSEITYNILNSAISISNNAKLAADNAVIDAENALALIGAVSNDGVLSTSEKPAVVQQYNIILAEFTGILNQADGLGITTERTAYANAENALEIYIEGLLPAYDDYTQSTIIVRVDFNNAFELYYTTKQTLLNAIYEATKLLADNAAIIARSKGKHFIAEPTTPYYVGDTWSNTIDLYRCIIQRLVGAFSASDWEVATHYDRTKVTMDNGMITAGRLEVGGGELGEGNAGINGSVSGSPTTDIRFWAGADYANRTTAPWRVQDNGEFWGTSGHIGGWNVDSDSIFSGAKKIGNGFATNAGDLTLKSDGSLHTKNFYINADGTVGVQGVAEFKADPASYIAVKIQGGHLWEDDWDNDTATLEFNTKGYHGGYTRFRSTQFGDGKGNGMFRIDGQTKIISNLYPTVIRDTGYTSETTPNAGSILELQSTRKAFRFTKMTRTQMDNMLGIENGMMVYDITNDQFAGRLNGVWWKFGMIAY
jgi:hypothetical protein